MKKNNTFLVTVVFFLGVATVNAQEGRAGINTTTPKTTLDVNGKTDTSGNLLTTDITGLQAPRLTRAELTAKGNILYGTDQKGALVYITDISAGDALSQRINIDAIGYYYFDGNVWQKIGGTDWAKVGTTNAAITTDDQYISGAAIIGGTSTSTAATVANTTSNSTSAQKLAKLTLLNGDASINGLTLGLGGGQSKLNTVLGYEALNSNIVDAAYTKGWGNTAIGFQALSNNTTATFNTAIGFQALLNNTTAISNTAIGFRALYRNTNGERNVAVGQYALLNTTAANYSVAVGFNSLLDNTTGGGNTAIGTETLIANTTGWDNVAVGRSALGAVTTGNQNIGIGLNAGNALTTGENNIVIGTNQQVVNPTESNQLNIGGSIWGNELSSSTAKIGVGKNANAPKSTLQVVGSFATNIIVYNSTSIELNESHHTWVYNGTNEAATINLPDPTTCRGREYRIVNAANAISAATITFSLPIQINPVNSITTITQDLTNGITRMQGIGHSILIQSDGVLWWYVGN